VVGVLLWYGGKNRCALWLVLPLGTPVQ
jgi:hypothetical protein